MSRAQGPKGVFGSQEGLGLKGLQGLKGFVSIHSTGAPFWVTYRGF